MVRKERVTIMLFKEKKFYQIELLYVVLPHLPLSLSPSQKEGR